MFFQFIFSKQCTFVIEWAENYRYWQLGDVAKIELGHNR